MSDVPRFIPMTEDEMAELVIRSGPANQYVPAVWGVSGCAIDRLEPGSEWALDELHIIRREDRERARES